MYVCDTFLGPDSMKDIARIIKDNGHHEKPVVVFNSHADWDHVWGNCYFEDAMIISHRECRNRMIAEWEEELDQCASAKLRRSSARKLSKTKRQYSQLISAMKRAERKMDPVLTAFHDQVLFLKHNLNAKAIASLQTELGSVEAEVNSLIRDMEASIKEADAFISAMAKE